MQRLGASRMFASAVVCTSTRMVKSTDPTHEDDRWLEAQIAEHNKTPEERYAADKQRAVLKNMMAKMREENQDHVASVRLQETAARNEEVGGLKKQLADLQTKIADILAKK
jgi:hypothetical protein